MPFLSTAGCAQPGLQDRSRALRLPWVSRLLHGQIGALVFALIGTLLFSQPAGAIDLVINEVLADNESILADDFGEFEDWIEILNTGSTPVNLEGMFLSDDFGFPNKFELPDTIIQSGDYLLVWCDDDPEQGLLHAGFKLDKDGEAIGLFNTLFYDIEPIDTLSFGPQREDISWGRYPDGTGPFTYLGVVTPEAENAEPINLPPFLFDTAHLPALPLASDTVWVSTRIIEDGVIADAKIFFDPGSGFQTASLFDDGMHQDGLAGDGWYGGAIGPLGPVGEVSYFVWALDDLFQVGTDPPDAPGESFHFIIDYEAPPLTINEFLASNGTTNTDEWGDFDDWVEIYNAGSETVTMTGMFLSDDLTEPSRFEFPETELPPGGFLLVWCDDEPAEGPYHAPFKLSAGGEQIGLFDSEQFGLTVIDSLTYGLQSTDISFGRSPDGGAAWQFFENPTPGGSNGPGSSVSGLPEIASVFRPLGAAPNPFGSATHLAFELDESTRVRLQVYDAAGREVAKLVDRRLPAGKHEIVWDGQSDARGRVVPGVYFYRIEAGDGLFGGKLIKVP